jgi:long-chain acyl-CoA synthetase
VSVHIGSFVRHHASSQPDAPALQVGELALSYRTLDRRAAGCAARLRSFGVAANDRVMFVLPNSVEWVVLYQGTLQAGAVPVPINPMLAAAELAAIIADCEPRVVFARAAMAAQLRQGIGQIASVVDIDAEPFTSDEADPQPLPRAGSDDIALILYSSGSTGLPKGIELSHANIFWNAQAFAFDLLRLTPDDRGLTGLPLSHVFGHTCLYTAFLFAGASITLVERFDAAAILATIHSQRITVFMGVPTMYWTLLREEIPASCDLSSWRACVSGGQALPEEVHRKFEAKFGVAISEGYGMTEASPSVTGCRLRGASRKSGSAGQPYLGVELRIVDDEGRDVPRGERGEILVAGPGVARGYFRQPELTAQTFRNGWLHSGDIGYVDRDGFLFVVDRKKEMIISGGYNIYPREIEEVAHAVEGIYEVAAIGVPDDRLGERIVAYVVLESGASVPEETLLQRCSDQLARYKVPREVRFLKALPRNATGKIDRRRLRDLSRDTQ